MDGSRSKKADVIRHALGIAFENIHERVLSGESLDLEKVLMVGDRSYDVRGAHETGIACAAVSYGYGSKHELEKAGADFIVDSPPEILNIVRGCQIC